MVINLNYSQICEAMIEYLHKRGKVAEGDNVELHFHNGGVDVVVNEGPTPEDPQAPAN